MPISAPRQEFAIRSRTAECNVPSRLVQTPTSRIRAFEEIPFGDTSAAVDRTEPALLELQIRRNVEGPRGFCIMLDRVCSPREVCGKEGCNVKHQFRRVVRSRVQRRAYRSRMPPRTRSINPRFKYLDTTQQPSNRLPENTVFRRIGCGSYGRLSSHDRTRTGSSRATDNRRGVGSS